MCQEWVFASLVPRLSPCAAPGNEARYLHMWVFGNETIDVSHDSKLVMG